MNVILEGGYACENHLRTRGGRGSKIRDFCERYLWMAPNQKHWPMVSFSLVPFHMILILLVNRSISRKDIILHGCSNAYTQNKQLYYRCHTLLKFGKIKVCLDIFDCPLREVNNHKKRETTFLFTSLQVTSEQSLVTVAGRMFLRFRSKLTLWTIILADFTKGWTKWKI